MQTTQLAQLRHVIDATCMTRDRHRLRGQLRGVEQAAREGRPFDQMLGRLLAEIERSASLRASREAARPRPVYPAELPVVERRDEIAGLIAKHQVVVLSGETGSGKTTQLPKICLELGRGVAGMIGHTQPRRIAARSVAARIAEELSVSLGAAVGYKVRFNDRTAPDTYIKLMTDGILLAETQQDRFLEQYDTILIDEAHERSLNIDFLLGYLKQLLPRRPDLKLIITSATIDPQRFSRHFNDAPMIEISGRVYPVEVRYRPAAPAEDDPEEVDQLQAILDSVDEVAREGPGDVLVFLPGEREIREAAEALRKHHPPGTEILPLYARLGAEEQNKVFQPHGRRRIVLATNVAETSLTVPGIRYVVDSGLARVSRYSPRTKVQRLPIEPVSRASADQRKGRCGRVGPGVCVRLYTQDDFESRPPFTEPEILRTNLASVILQMKALRLGDVQAFPFVEPPDFRAVRDGYQTLHELGAIDERNELTETGRRLAKLPIDPRVGRMVLQAVEENCLDEAMIIASALTVQDPRERPMDQQPAADAAHAKFRDDGGDFLGMLKLWDFYHAQARHLSQSKLRKACKENFLSFVRMREWHDVHQQLHALIAEMGLTRRATSAQPDESGASTAGPDQKALTPVKTDAVHRALLAGLLSNIGQKSDSFEYSGARGTRFFLFPGSSLFAARPPWVMAAELVETTRLYARTVARIRPEWCERLGDHLVKRTYSDPHWDPQTRHVSAYEKVTLYGLTLVPRRTVHYGPIDPKLSREIFIQSALVDGDYDATAPYFRHNQKLIDEIEALEAKRRQRDVLVDAKVRFEFYDKRIPAGITNGPAFEKWRREAERLNPRLLYMTRHDLMRHGADDATADQFPDVLLVNDGLALPLSYHLEVGHPADGVTVTVPLAVLNQVPAERFEWLVPGMLLEKVAALIKSLPKPLRVNFVPAPQWAQRAMEKLRPGDGALYEALAAFLSRAGPGVTVKASDFDPASLLDHLHFNFKVVDDAGKVLAHGRDLAALRRQFGLAAKETFASGPVQSPWHRDEITRWDFGDLPESVEIKRNGMTLRGYPALVDAGETAAALRVLDSPEAAREASRGGLRRLFMLQLGPELKQLSRSLPGISAMCLQYATLGNCDELKAQIVAVTAERALLDDPEEVRTQEAFVRRAEAGWRRLSESAQELCDVVGQTLCAYQELLRQIERPMPAFWKEAIADVRRQLGELLPKDFITKTPAPWLGRLPRFLRAAGIRITKLATNGHVKDAALQAQVAPLWQQYVERLAAHRANGIVDPALEHYRWMLEEFRVSLWAQELKTSAPVSAKRLEALWEKVQDPSSRRKSSADR